jgi:lipopolysaccharide/colanic/teichoic acid biosynthesis glycosyltransferase
METDVRQTESALRLVQLRLAERVQLDLFFKRQFDLFLSLAALILLAPLLFLVLILIKVDSSGRAMYTTKRIGKNGRIFYMFKFRSMSENAEQLLREDPELKKEFNKKFKLANDKRVTSIGRILRRTGLDELPQLLNILRGDMSFVGPRPLLLKERRKASKHRLEVPPGLTGLWQIKGKNALSYKQKDAWDKFYARKRHFFLDLAILIQTLPAIIRGKGF